MSNIRVRLKSRQAIRTKLRPQQGVKVDNQKLYLYDPSIVDAEVELARDWAVKTDGLVEEEDYSSKAWAIGGTGTETNNSKYYASQAATSASNAYTSETNAAASASTATTQAGIATTQAGIATTKAGEATTSASTATTQAGIATTQAGIATTKAGEASTSATNAGNSASQASTSATNSYNSAGQAATSATSASNYATNANIWAEGTDVQVQALGGIHSAKVWVESIGTVYKAAGSVLFANLPTLGAEYEGYVYNVSDDFTTTSDFVEGAGVDYPAGTNVVCIKVSGVYKWDVLGSFIDISGKQDVLVSGKNIKTVNNQSLLGSGNITIGGSVDSVNGQTGAVVLTASDVGALPDSTVIPTVNNSTISFTQGGVTKGSFTLNQSTGATIDLDAGVTTDGTTINKNSSGELQTIGVINQNDATKAIKSWSGTKAQYDALPTKDADTLYNITDDSDAQTYEAYTKSETDALVNAKQDKITGVSGVGDYVVEWKAPTSADPSWYRKYKSGWIEQGGKFQGAATNVEYTVTLSKPYDSTEYYVSVNQVTKGSGTNTVYDSQYVVNKTTGSFGVVQGQSERPYYNWKTEGMGA